MSADQFPILKLWPERCFPPQLTSIPWAMIAPHEAQALKNHCGQTLARLAQRGGLSADEAVAVLEDMDYYRRWPRTNGTREAIDARSETAINRLREMVAEWLEITPQDIAETRPPTATEGQTQQ